MILNIQDPTNQDSLSLHEALISACTGAQLGGGVFAFVTVGGVRLYLEDNTFLNFVSNGRFDLVVGIDEITNTQTLEFLGRLSVASPNLNVQAFSHDSRESIFHPKFCWFRKAEGGTLIVGSGNLTVRGLRKNWEAFIIHNLTEEELIDVERIWNEWRDNCNDLLRPIDDVGVIARAEQNIIRRRRIIQAEREILPVEIEEILEFEEPEDSSPWIVEDTQAVLIAEIPAGGNRWNQANFNQISFENFFGGIRWDNSYRILLRSVNNDGSLEEIENRQAVSVKSHNWRIELASAAGLDYPILGRPTGVFIRVGVRMFLYKLIMPDSDFYDQINAYLTEEWNGPANRMRRIQTDVITLRNNCPTLPFWI
jgi:HKD family nuclease